MNNRLHSGKDMTIVNIVVTVVNISIFIKMLDLNLQSYKRYLRVKERAEKRDCKRHHFKGRNEKKIDKKYYEENIKKLRYLLDEAYQQMQRGQFHYAIYKADSVIKEAIKMLLQYENGGDIPNNLLINMKICECENLFGTNKKFINRLYKVYQICEYDREKNINHRKVYFTIMQLKDLLNFAQKRIIDC